MRTRIASGAVLLVVVVIASVWGLWSGGRPVTETTAESTTEPVEVREPHEATLVSSAAAAPTIRSAPVAHKVSAEEYEKERAAFARVSGLLAPKPFDQEAYEADPEAYCAEVVPGRVFDCAQPGPDVPQLALVGNAYYELPHQGSVVLRAKAVPGAPVTFFATDLAVFENGATSITVPADDQGLAEATWQALPGTVADGHVTAGCPLTSSRVVWVVNVARPPEE